MSSTSPNDRKEQESTDQIQKEVASKDEDTQDDQLGHKEKSPIVHRESKETQTDAKEYSPIPSEIPKQTEDVSLSFEEKIKRKIDLLLNDPSFQGSGMKLTINR